MDRQGPATSVLHLAPCPISAWLCCTRCSQASRCPLRPARSSWLHKYGLLLRFSLDLFSSSSTQHRLLLQQSSSSNLSAPLHIYSFSNSPLRRIFNLYSSCLTLLMVVSSRTSSPEISPATMSSLLKPRNSLPLPLLSVRSVILSSSSTVASLPWRAS